MRLGVFPLVVNPQPVRRTGADLLFQSASVRLDDPIAFAVVKGWLGKHVKVHRVMAPTQPTHRNIDDSRLEKARDLYGTHEEGSVLMQECRPVLVHALERRLI